jgi:hypothetical protein
LNPNTVMENETRIKALEIKLRRGVEHANKFAGELRPLRERENRRKLFFIGSIALIAWIPLAIFTARAFLPANPMTGSDILIILIPVGFALAVFGVMSLLEVGSERRLSNETRTSLRYAMRVLEESVRAASQFVEHHPKADETLLAQLDADLFEAESTLRKTEIALEGSGFQVRFFGRGGARGQSESEVAQAFEVLRTLKRRLGHSNAIKAFAGELIEQLLTTLANRDKQELLVKTSSLYSAIVREIDAANKVRILDQDVFRWAEVVNPSLRISANVINYSNAILQATLRRAQENPDFELKRVFVIDPDWLTVDEQKRTIVEIFREIDSYCKSYEARIGNFVLYMAEPRREGSPFASKVDFNSLRDVVEHLKDVVIFEADVMYKENITYRHPANALESGSSIVVDTDEILQAIERFDAMTPYLFDLPDFLKLWTQEANRALQTRSSPFP